MALLSNSLSSVASLHIQILASDGNVTSFEVVAFVELMTIGKALAPRPIRPTTVMVGLVRVLPNFFQLWMNLIFFCSTASMMLSGSSVMALIFSIFEFSVAIASMKTSKFLLAISVSFMARRYVCQLLLGVCQLTFGMFTFTFYELESSRLSSLRLIPSGTREARQ